METVLQLLNNQVLIETLNDTVFTPCDIEEDYERNTIQFHIKQCPGWLFGCWWEGAIGTFFYQHEDLIDKFRPSTSRFFCEIELEEPNHDIYINEVFQRLQFLHNHSEVAFYAERNWLDLNYHYVDEATAIAEYTLFKTGKQERARLSAEVREKWRNFVRRAFPNNTVGFYNCDGIYYNYIVSSENDGTVYRIDEIITDEQYKELDDFYYELEASKRTFMAKYNLYYDPYVFSPYIKAVSVLPSYCN